VSSIPIFHFLVYYFYSSHFYLYHALILNLIFHVEGTRTAAAFNRNTSEAASVASSSVSNTATAYIPTAIINNTVAASVDAASTPTTASTSLPNTAAISISTAYHTAVCLPIIATSLPNASHPNAPLPATAAASLPNASLPATAATSLPTTTASATVESSESALDPIKAKEFHDAADDKSIPLADFLRKLQLTENVYGDDTDMINSLTSNTSKHGKERLKVCSNYFVNRIPVISVLARIFY
jgi:hypothetical protein